MRLSRFEPDSELVRLNASPAGAVRVGPTLTALLDWARVAEERTDGVVDVAMLDARLAAEDGRRVVRPVAAGRRWSLRRLPRGAVVERQPGVRFDLDGVAKGWLADRALGLAAAPSAVVDADGDIAVRIAPGDAWTLGVADPRPPAGLLAVIHLEGGTRGRSVGLATSGTSVHRWSGSAGLRHHLIDPSTWLPARTDVVQATVLADSARLAEVVAKVAVILGTDAAFELAERPGVLGVLLMTEGGEVRASEGMVRWLA
jgi:thiamine biosynthesis lipoprotein